MALTDYYYITTRDNIGYQLSACMLDLDDAKARLAKMQKRFTSLSLVIVRIQIIEEEQGIKWH